MKPIFVSAAFALAVSLFVGCEDYNSRPPKKNMGGYHPPKPIVTDVPPDNPEPSPEPPPKPVDPAPAQVPGPEPIKPVGEVPYAKPVPGKPGFVTSPNFPFKGYIDVRGYPPGTEVTDPYATGKSFLVP